MKTKEQKSKNYQRRDTFGNVLYKIFVIGLGITVLGLFWCRKPFQSLEPAVPEPLWLYVLAGISMLIGMISCIVMPSKKHNLPSSG
jgi:hypothetical protein